MGQEDSLLDCEEHIDRWMKVLREIYSDKGLSSVFETEEGLLRAYLHALCKELNGRYRLEGPRRIGGSGVVFEASHEGINDKLALKFNRPLKDDNARRMMQNEYEILPTLDHPNIVRVVDRGKIPVGESELTYIIEYFIEDSKTISEYIEELLKAQDMTGEKLVSTGDDESATNFQPGYLRNVLEKLIEVALQWADSLNYLHTEKSCVYLDVKPENALVDGSGILRLVDFGTCQHYLKSPKQRQTSQSSPGLGEVQQEAVSTPLAGDEYIDVFFTEEYGHPRLREKKTHKTSRNRVIAQGVPRSFLMPEFDYYSFGISLIEILREIEGTKPHDAPNLNLFRSLHLIATLLLDGHNQDLPEWLKTKHPESLVRASFGGLDPADYNNLKYKDLGRVIRDFRKELGTWNLERRVPELDQFSTSVIRIVPNLNTVRTERLVRIIEHPLFARLKSVSQLGLVSLVYPTADHSRFDHALGTYTYAANYINALFHDAQNPIFRILVDDKDVEAALLATLLHDLGQYPLAHDLVEVNKRIFKHESLSLELLDDPTVDDNGKTLADIIQNGANGWGTELEHVRSILRASPASFDSSEVSDSSRSFKDKMMSALVSGPIDADKVDYLTRDSSQCRIPYGNQLDVERLLRVITIAVIIEKTSSRRAPVVAVYEKGRASAEAISLARYLIYSSVYWHHSSRVLKSMLQYAVASGLTDQCYRDGKDAIELRKKLKLFVLGIETEGSGKASGKLAESSQKVNLESNPGSLSLEELMQSPQEEQPSSSAKLYPGLAWGDWKMLEWLKKELPHPNPATELLINSILSRRLYKRVVTFNRIEDRVFVSRFDDLSGWEQWPRRLVFVNKFQKLVGEEVLKRLKEDKKEKKGVPPLTASMVPVNRIEKLFSAKMTVLVDIPNIKDKKIGPLTVVPELKEKTYFQESKSQPLDIPDWTDPMMDSIGPLRVLSHPDLKVPITFELGKSDDLRKVMMSFLTSALE